MAEYVDAMLYERCYVKNWTYSGVQFGRGDFHFDEEKRKLSRHETVEVLGYMITNNGKNIIPVDFSGGAFLLDTENYLIEWNFKTTIFSINKKRGVTTLHEKIRLGRKMSFCWKGIKAVNLEELEFQSTGGIKHPVIKVFQWLEPTIFLRIFKGRFIVNSPCNDHAKRRLYILCSIVKPEGRLYEVPCSWSSIRSRTCFLLVDNERQKVVIWHGSTTCDQAQELIRSYGSILRRFFFNDRSDLPFEIEKEGCESEYFSRSLSGDRVDYYSCVLPQYATNTMRIIYFLPMFKMKPNELKDLHRYFLKTIFPFTVFHLYYFYEPALLVIDAGYKVFVWYKPNPYYLENDGSPNHVLKKIIQFADVFSKKKEYINRTELITSSNETIEFKSLFPFWFATPNTYNEVIEHSCYNVAVKDNILG